MNKYLIYRRIKYSFVFLTTCAFAWFQFYCGEGIVTGLGRNQSDTKIVFSAEISGSNSIYSINSNGTDIQMLFKGIYPVCSPDSSIIAYCTNMGNKLSIFTSNIDGSNITQITNPPFFSNDFRPVWSPDGRKIVFERASLNESNLLIYDIETSTLNQITHFNDNFDTHLFLKKWSPDGMDLSFLYGNASTIYKPSGALMLHKSGIVNTLNNGELISSYSWNTDSSIYLISRSNNNNLELVDFSITQDTAIAVIDSISNSYSVSANPVDGRIAFTAGPSIHYNNLYIIYSEGSEVKKVTDVPENYAVYNLKWSPDGSKLAFIMGLTNSYNRVLHSDIYTINNDSNNLLKITNSHGKIKNLSWSPDK